MQVVKHPLETVFSEHHLRAEYFGEIAEDSLSQQGYACLLQQLVFS